METNLTNTSCIKCGSKDILHTEKQGRGLPPKNYVKKLGDNRLISWVGIWYVWTCKGCGDKVESLKRN